MKIVKGWRKMDQQRGFVNETTGQNLVVTKKEFGPDYVVMLYSKAGLDDVKGETISPEYATASKAEAYGLSWMGKHPKGIESLITPT
jgi:hypothetical protein